MQKICIIKAELSSGSLQSQFEPKHTLYRVFCPKIKLTVFCLTSLIHFKTYALIHIS